MRQQHSDWLQFEVFSARMTKKHSENCRVCFSVLTCTWHVCTSVHSASPYALNKHSGYFQTLQQRMSLDLDQNPTIIRPDVGIASHSHKQEEYGLLDI